MWNKLRKTLRYKLKKLHKAKLMSHVKDCFTEYRDNFQFGFGNRMKDLGVFFIEEAYKMMGIPSESIYIINEKSQV